MSKKELLNEAQIRRFMTLANLEPLVKNTINESNEKEEDRKANQTPPSDKARGTAQKSVKEEYSMEADEAPGDMADTDMPDMEMDSSSEEESGDTDKEAVFAAAVKALADALGVEVEMNGDESGEEDAAEDAPEDAPEDAAEKSDEASGDEKEEMEERKSKEEEMDENAALSEDSLVEAVLARVTARLVAEAGKKKETSKQKMARMKKEKEAAAKKKKALEEATDSKGGGPLLKQGKNKHDTYKGHADMEYGKGKDGKGGHEMETLAAKAGHSVTHGGKNLATLGGIKKK
jgi:hypothetical protein